MPSRLVAAMLLLPLAACGSGEVPGNAAAENAASGDYIARVQALNEKERNAVLFRAVRDAGRACQRVERSVAVEPLRGKPAWVATCDDNSAWLVAIGNDGTATVTDARAAAGAAKG